MPEPKHEGIGLGDSYLFSGLTDEVRNFIEDNEAQLIHLISELLSKDNAVVTVEARRKEIILIETNYAVQFR